MVSARIALYANCPLDPIIGIDASADGKWILATCKTYLLVAPTTFDNNGERALGFEVSYAYGIKLPNSS
jgi:hypothetical protein